jgi:hypothetical protein
LLAEFLGIFQAKISEAELFLQALVDLQHCAITGQVDPVQFPNLRLSSGADHKHGLLHILIVHSGGQSQSVLQMVIETVSEWFWHFFSIFRQSQHLNNPILGHGLDLFHLSQLIRSQRQADIFSRQFERVERLAGQIVLGGVSQGASAADQNEHG